MSQEPLALISEVLTKVTKKQTPITLESDLTEHLDSLDSLVFFLELEERTGVPFPDGNLAKEGYFKVEKLAGHLRNAA